MKRLIVVLAVAAFFNISARGQGFVNLNFESVQNFTNNSDGFIAITNALPFWTAYGGSTLSEVYYVTNYPYGSSSLVELEGGSAALGGNFSVGLYDGGSISQTGLVPGDTGSLQFDAYVPSASGFVVTLGGQNLSLLALSQLPNYTVYGANIPVGMDGQMETLTFLIEGSTPGVLLDNIGFWPTGVPEPAEFVLIGLGAILFGLCRRRKHQRMKIEPQRANQTTHG